MCCVLLGPLLIELYFISTLFHLEYNSFMQCLPYSLLKVLKCYSLMARISIKIIFFRGLSLYMVQGGGGLVQI